MRIARCVAVALVLAGCAPPFWPARAPEPDPAPDAAVPDGARLPPEAFGAIEPPPAARRFPPPPLPPSKPTRSTFNPEALIGADEFAVRSRLGPPRATEDAPPSIIWVYGDALCELDLFFYLDMANDKRRVLNYTLRVSEESPRRRSRCLRWLGDKTGL